MTDEELVEGVRSLPQRHDVEPQPPAQTEAVAGLEALVGYPMPALLRRLYLEVADGWGHWLPVTDMAEWYQYWIKEQEPDLDDEDYIHVHPRTLVPVTEPDCGFHITFVEFGTEQGNIWLWNGEVGWSRHHWFPAPFTVADYVACMAYGARLRPWQQESNKHCKRCREGQTYGKCPMGIPGW
jgi:hypothetical protein